MSYWVSSLHPRTALGLFNKNGVSRNSIITFCPRLVTNESMIHIQEAHRTFAVRRPSYNIELRETPAETGFGYLSTDQSLAGTYGRGTGRSNHFVQVPFDMEIICPSISFLRLTDSKPRFPTIPISIGPPHRKCHR